MNKNIVICFDGAGSEYSKNITNVVKMYDLVDKNNVDEQIAFYHPGVATGGWEYDEDEVKAKADNATGNGLQNIVDKAYHYLMHRYNKGDKIYLFGYSRGAFTARSLAGMLQKCGLLRSDLDGMVEYASKMYNTENNKRVASGFKRTFSQPCLVEFIGVWDTVGSLALNAGKKFHDVSLNPDVKYGYHALSLDEVRKFFPPYLWSPRNNVEQVWFAGVHSNVGGWYDDTGLSDIALKWMATKAKKHGLSLNMKKFGKIKGNALAAQHDSQSSIFWKYMGSHIRAVPKNSKVHSSVKQRLGVDVQILADDGNRETKVYQPQATMKDGSAFSPEKVQWVDDDDE